MQNENQQPETAMKSHSNAPALVIALGIVVIIAAVNFLAPGWTKVRADENAKFEAAPAPVIENSAPVAPAAIPAVPDEPLKVTEVKAEAPATATPQPEVVEAAPVAPEEHPMPAIRLILGELEKDADENISFKETGLIVAGQPFAVKIELTELPDDTKAVGARVKFPTILVPTERSNPDKIPAKIKFGSMELAWLKGYESKTVSVFYEFKATTSLDPLEFEASYEWRGDVSEEHKISEQQSFTFLASALPATPTSESSKEENLASAK